MKRAPKSLNASVGPWNSSRMCSRSPSVTSGTGKLNASVTIFFRTCVRNFVAREQRAHFLRNFMET